MLNVLSGWEQKLLRCPIKARAGEYLCGPGGDLFAASARVMGLAYASRAHHLAAGVLLLAASPELCDPADHGVYGQDLHCPARR